MRFLNHNVGDVVQDARASYNSAVARYTADKKTYEEQCKDPKYIVAPNVPKEGEMLRMAKPSHPPSFREEDVRRSAIVRLNELNDRVKEAAARLMADLSE